MSDQIIIVAGQSNARAYETTGLDVPLALQGMDAGIKIWNTHTGAFETYAAGINSDTWNSGAASPQKWGPEAAFAHAFRAANPSIDIHIVKIAVDAATLAAQSGDDWSPAELFADMTAELVLAKAALTDPIVEALLWMQGEHDGDNSTKATNYGVNLAALIGAVRSDWGDADTKVLLGRISPSEEWDFGATVRAFQMRIARDISGVVAIDTDGYALAADDKHYVAASIVTLGEDMHDAYEGSYPLLPVRFERHSQKKNANISLSNGDLTAEGGGANASAYQVVYATAILSDDSYWEYEIVGKVGNLNVGLGQAISLSTFLGEGGSDNSVGYAANGGVWFGGAQVQTYAAYGAGDRINVIFHRATGKVWFGKNGSVNGDPVAGTGQAATLPATTTTNYHRPAVTLRRSGDIVTGVFSGFTDTPPAGFSAI